jgi:hypothetical protein
MFIEVTHCFCTIITLEKIYNDIDCSALSIVCSLKDAHIKTIHYILLGLQEIEHIWNCCSIL